MPGYKRKKLSTAHVYDLTILYKKRYTDSHGEERKGNKTTVKLKQVQYICPIFYFVMMGDNVKHLKKYHDEVRVTELVIMLLLTI